jgi:hypothetical protein
MANVGSLVAGRSPELAEGGAMPQVDEASRAVIRRGRRREKIDPRAGFDRSAMSFARQCFADRYDANEAAKNSCARRQNVGK